MVGPSGQFSGFTYFISKIFYDIWDLCNITADILMMKAGLYLH